MDKVKNLKSIAFFSKIRFKQIHTALLLCFHIFLLKACLTTVFIAQTSQTNDAVIVVCFHGMLYFTVFVVCAQGDTYRKMALLAQSIGMKRGEYVLIFFNTLNRDEPEGDYSWKRGDNLDEVNKPL